MNLEKQKAIIEAILFAAGRVIKINEFMAILEISSDEVISIINKMQDDYKCENRGIEIIKVEDGYQLATKKEMYEYLYPIFDKRSKPNLSNASMETLAIIAYNPKITRAEIEAIRGVNSDGTIYKLLEYNLIENVGKADLPGRPTMYSTTENFLKMFGISSLEELPDLPRYKLDENEQIVIEEVLEAPMPAREDSSVVEGSKEEKKSDVSTDKIEEEITNVDLDQNLTDETIKDLDKKFEEDNK